MEMFYESSIATKTEINGEFYIKATNINRILESFSFKRYQQADARWFQ
jgi:hypothetical protein